MVVGKGTIVDLFCGCGGFSLGAELAGFRSLVAVDVDPTLQSAYRKNFPQTKSVCGSVTDIDKSAWRQLIGSVRPDAVIGGPPCQGFSRIGKRLKDDPRNSLIGHFYRHVEELRPKFFVMENVEGLLDSDNVDMLMSSMEKISKYYKVIDPIIVNASHFGAATKRRRVVVVGYDPSEVDPIDVDSILPSVPIHLTTVKDAISDLPSPTAENGDRTDFGWAQYPELECSLSDYARQLRAAPPEGLGWNEARAFHSIGILSGLFKTRHSEAVTQRYASIPGGKSDSVSKSFRLEWEGLCPTLRAGTGADKGAFQAVRPIHPGEGRVITVREAARLQGFPDWFVFHQAKWHSFRMIGNSVSPFVSRGIMEKIASRMHS